VPNDTDLDDDNDGIPDLQDPDRDGDAISNVAERAAGTDPDDRGSPGGVPAGDSSNGDGGFNDRCAGSIPIAPWPAWTLLIFGLALFTARGRIRS